MKTVASTAGATLLFIAGWLALASWAFDRAGNSLAPIEGMR